MQALSLNFVGSYIDRNLRLVKALIKSMSESIRALGELEKEGFFK